MGAGQRLLFEFGGVLLRRWELKETSFSPKSESESEVSRGKRGINLALTRRAEGDSRLLWIEDFLSLSIGLMEEDEGKRDSLRCGSGSVSYTHLTQPTKRIV